MADKPPHHYPLTKMNFVVTVEGLTGVAAFTEVTGLDASVDVIEFRQGNAASMSPIKIPGLVKHGNLTLKMGYVSGQAIKEWIVQCVDDTRKTAFVRRTMTVELIDITDKPLKQTPYDTSDTAANKVWTLKECWIAKYTGPDLNASTSEVAIETIEVAFEEIVLPN